MGGSGSPPRKRNGRGGKKRMQTRRREETGDGRRVRGHELCCGRLGSILVAAGAGAGAAVSGLADGRVAELIFK